MNKKSTILISLSVFHCFVYAQNFNPQIENFNIIKFRHQQVQKNGCPTPIINIQINPEISPVVWDYSLRSRDLKNISNKPGQVVGLHKASTSINVQSQVYYLTDNNGYQTCFTIWPSYVTIRLKSKIYVASEIAMLYCSKNNTEDHELEHQKVAIWALTQSQNSLYQDLNLNFQKIKYFNTYIEAENHYNTIISKLQNNFLYQYDNISIPLNSKLDSNENYAFENKKCQSDTSTLTYYLGL